MENWTPEANVPADKPCTQFLATIFGKKVQLISRCLQYLPNPVLTMAQLLGGLGRAGYLTQKVGRFSMRNGVQLIAKGFGLKNNS